MWSVIIYSNMLCTNNYYNSCKLHRYWEGFSNIYVLDNLNIYKYTVVLSKTLQSLKYSILGYIWNFDITRCSFYYLCYNS